MAASHTGEDAHVRTLQAVFRRAGLSQSLLACGSEGAPQDTLTAARLARDGEEPGPIRHMCSGFHTASLLLSRHMGWSLADYWRPEHPSQVAVREAVAGVFGVATNALRTSVDSCGVYTYAFPLADIARAFALLAEPGRTRHEASLTRIRDAMMAAPEMVGGSRDSSDTQLMKARRGAIVIEGRRRGTARGRPAARRARRQFGAGRSGHQDRGRRPEFARQPGGHGRGAGPAGRARRGRARAPGGLPSSAQLRPARLEVGESVPSFELAPLSELA